MIWIEEYAQCGCSSDASRRKDLLGYCAIHGSDRTNIIKLPGNYAEYKRRQEDDSE